MVQIQRAGSAALLLLLLLIQPMYATESKETKAVLVLYSEDHAHPAHELTDQGIRTAFRSNKLFDVHLYTEYLDLSRFSSPVHARALADYLQRKYAGSKIDAIIAVYPAAVNVLLGEAGEAFPGVPIVACEMSRSYAENLDRSPSRSFITGAVMGDNVSGVLDAALRMRPDTKRVALIAGTGPNDAYGEQVFRNGLKPYDGKLELIDLTKLPMEDILTRVGSLPPETIVLYSSVFRDGTGRSFVPREALSLISRAANAPVFSLFDTYLGYGIVGGRLVSVEQQGKEAAALALRILGGEAPASIPFTGEQAYVSLYDWRELKRWDIPGTAVPPGSEIRYRQPSLWDEHGRAIAVVGVLIMVETALIFGLVTNLRRRRKAERSLRESEIRYRALYEGSADGIFLFDDSGTILDGNEACLRMFGYSLEEIWGTTVVDLIHPEDLKATPFKLGETRKGEIVRIDRRMRKKDGSFLTVEVSGRRVGENLVQGLYRDITDRKRAEEAVSRSERLLNNIIEQSPFSMWISDSKGTLIRLNDACRKTLRISDDDVVGKYNVLTDNIVEEQGFMPLVQSVFEHGTTARFEIEYDSFRLAPLELHETVSLILDVTIFPVLGPNGKPANVVCQHIDVTERRRAQASLKESEERYRAVFNNAGLGIGVVGKEGRFSQANPALVNMLGYTEEELRQFTPLDITHPEDREFSKQYVGGTMGGEFDPVGLEKRYIKKDGSAIWGHISVSSIRDAEGKPRDAVAVIADITDRKRTEEELVQAKHYWEETFDSITDAITVHDKDFNIIRYNMAGAKMLGLPDSLIPKGLKCYKYYHGENSPPGECPSCRCLETGEQAVFEKFEPHLNRHIEIRAIPRFDNNGQLTGLIHVVRDITDRKRAEEEKAGLELQLRQSQKMEAIGTLSGGIAHDFNNLLTVILGFSELIISEKDKKDRDYEDLKKVIHAARTAGDMVQQILAFSRKAETKLRPLNLNRQVEQLRKMISRLIPRTIEVQINLDPALPTVSADHAQIDQILVNLAVNARDAMPQGGNLIIETKLIVLDDEYCRSHVEASGGAHALLAVSDTGIGIDKASMDRIFEPFYTTKKPGEGTGLGLAMVYGIVKSHGGHITCDSAPGAGTVFKIYLPVHQVESEVDVETSRSFLTFGTGTILLVDDEDFVRDLGKRLLEKAGYNVVTASDGREAVEIYKAQRGKVSLVILDLIMPVMDGKQCLEELLKIDPKVRVLIASGFAANGQTKEALEAGARGFVGKPYNMKEMLQSIREILDEGR